METVLLVIHLMVVLALIVVVLLQRSEGGGLGIGGGGGGGFMSSRGTANVLSRTTAILAGLFFLTSIGLTVIASSGKAPRSLLDGGSPQAPIGVPAAPTPDSSALDQLKSLSPPPQPAGSQPPQPSK
jgi:preprotein translocase subunit SecG